MGLLLRLSRSDDLSMIKLNGLRISGASTGKRKYGYIVGECQTALHSERVPMPDFYVSSVLQAKRRLGSEMFEKDPMREDCW